MTAVEAATARLRKTFAGELLEPGDPSYDPARAVWNAMIDRRPALIGRCHTRADVAARGVHNLDHGAFAGNLLRRDLWVRKVGSREQAVLADQAPRRSRRPIAVAAGKQTRASVGVGGSGEVRLRERCGLWRWSGR